MTIVDHVDSAATLSPPPPLSPVRLRFIGQRGDYWRLMIRGAFIGALFVGMVDTLGRSYFPDILRMLLSQNAASTAAPALSSMLIYLLMAVVLVVKPEGLFSPGHR